MATYRDLAGMQMPSLADMAQRMRQRREMQRMMSERQNPGAAPMDAMGGPQTVSLPGEAPVRAQPVSGGRVNPQAIMDPRAARLRALMSQGLSFEQAMRRIQTGG